MIADLAQQMYTELAEPSDISVASISAWMANNINRLNALMDGSLTVTNNEVNETMSQCEQTVLKKLYEVYYLKRQVNKNLGAASYSSIVEIEEGNRTARKTSKNEIAKTYMSALKFAQEELDAIILNCKMNSADPVQVLVSNPIIDEDFSIGVNYYARYGGSS